jgi:XTP/dITP diphosphohydrolase
MTQIVLATHNKHKMEELQGIFGDLGVELLTLDAFPQVGPIEEDAPTLEGNALKKGREVHRQTGLPTLADDTGLEVGYLNDAPGVYSSRYAGPDATYADNVQKLLRSLRGVPPRRRNARFRTVLAFIPSPGRHEIAEGIVSGIILESPRGTGGFGYDPVFRPDGHGLTYAEMDLATKNTLSHRARAAVAMREILRRHSG